MICHTVSPLAVQTFGTNFSFIVAILDGTAPIVTNVSSYPVVPTMASVPNQWNANANLAGLDTFATNPFAAQDVTKPLDFVPNPNSDSFRLLEIPFDPSEVFWITDSCRFL